MRKRVCITIDEQVFEKGSEIADLVPFSRYVQDLIEKDILERCEGEDPLDELAERLSKDCRKT